MSNYKYKFSVVIPILNINRYPNEAIQSVINQTIGFKENIQLILINYGDNDKNETICLKYKEKYPDNVVYIKQENIEVSQACNKGIEFAEGKYVNFLDVNDEWALNTFELVYSFFEKNKENIDVISCREKLFDRIEEYQKLDFKFEKTKIIDILEDYKYINLYTRSSFIKLEMAINHRFDTYLHYNQDTKYINEIIIEKCKYGVIREALYYRKEIDNSLLIQHKEKQADWYSNVFDFFYNDLIKLSEKNFQKNIPYIQYLIMYDIQERLKTPFDESVGIIIKQQYIENIKKLLIHIDDYIILKQKLIPSERKLYALELKYGDDIYDKLIFKKSKIYYNDISIEKIKERKSLLKIDFLDIKNEKLEIEGRINWIFPKEFFNIYVLINNKTKIQLDLIKGNPVIFNKKTFALSKQVLYHYTFKISLTIKDLKKISFNLCYNNNKKIKLTMNMGKFSKISDIENSYYIKDKKIVFHRKEDIIIINDLYRTRLKRKFEFAKELWNAKQYKILKYRLLYYIIKRIHKKPIWLISDRENKANDNGEHLFKYIVKQKNKKINAFFIIDKKSEDYKRIKKIGKVINANTLKSKIFFLLSSKIISSQANNYVTNFFEDDRIYLQDLFNFDFVFLQHGIIKDDLSKWLNKWNKNIKMFVTSGIPEYKSIINGNYGYTEKEVALTGLPRYDELIRKINTENHKKVLIIPTWRKTIKGSYDKRTGESKYLDSFNKTDYFKFYNKLINDERMIKVLKEKGYMCKFCLHPSHYKQYVDFQGNDYVEINDGFVDYQNEFAEASLLITDYSSVFFDFAYLKKPVIYSQFDKDIFFSGGHVYEKGYFDYEQGFGPVCYDYETTVNEIIKAIENDCKLEDQYLKRIEDFYFKFDANNCQRVYNKILQL